MDSFVKSALQTTKPLQIREYLKQVIIEGTKDITKISSIPTVTFKLGFPQLIGNAFLIFKSNLQVTLSIILKQRAYIEEHTMLNKYFTYKQSATGRRLH